jgi:hypothetical protein
VKPFNLDVGDLVALKENFSINNNGKIWEYSGKVVEVIKPYNADKSYEIVNVKFPAISNTHKEYNGVVFVSIDWETTKALKEIREKDDRYHALEIINI